MVVPTKVKALVPPIVRAPAPVLQMPPIDAADETVGCFVYDEAGNKPVSALPGTAAPQLETSLQLLSDPPPLHVASTAVVAETADENAEVHVLE
jgi:hypothetical protein